MTVGEWLSLGDVVGGGQLQSCDAEPLRRDGSGAAGLMVTLSKLSERREAPTVSIHGGILECVQETGLLFGAGVGSSQGKDLQRRGRQLGRDSGPGLEVGGRPPRARQGVVGGPGALRLWTWEEVPEVWP